MIALLGLLGLVGIGLLAALLVETRARRREAAVQAMLQTFGGAVAAARQDPRALVVWHPMADAARLLHPGAFAALDVAMGRRFPFPTDEVERAHARWTTEWLAWERAHDEEYRLRAAAVEQDIRGATGDAARLAKARLERVEHEKIERYQQRYEEYIRTAKALQALISR